MSAPKKKPRLSKPSDTTLGSAGSKEGSKSNIGMRDRHFLEDFLAKSLCSKCDGVPRGQVFSTN